MPRRGPHEVGVSPAHVAELQTLVDEGVLSVGLARRVLRRVAESGLSPREIVGVKNPPPGSMGDSRG